ncbi:hypothetical protein DFP72DRAFT_855736 [Ephemerocybe angulata]|uniref:Uncharacterized protein n=1 Tax=Ephemerocybe angulata TaxID=980116 RepID=A0A8H6HHV8_9AGAR|nr:hypothetical protein DFP72DRAFT_855736 [Tulosesus angulatus]
MTSSRPHLPRTLRPPSARQHPPRPEPYPPHCPTSRTHGATTQLLSLTRSTPAALYNTCEAEYHRCSALRSCRRMAGGCVCKVEAPLYASATLLAAHTRVGLVVIALGFDVSSEYRHVVDLPNGLARLLRGTHPKSYVTWVMRFDRVFGEKLTSPRAPDWHFRRERSMRVTRKMVRKAIPHARIFWLKSVRSRLPWCVAHGLGTPVEDERTSHGRVACAWRQTALLQAWKDGLKLESQIGFRANVQILCNESIDYSRAYKSIQPRKDQHQTQGFADYSDSARAMSNSTIDHPDYSRLQPEYRLTRYSGNNCGTSREENRSAMEYTYWTTVVCVLRQMTHMESSGLCNRNVNGISKSIYALLCIHNMWSRLGKVDCECGRRGREHSVRHGRTEYGRVGGQSMRANIEGGGLEEGFLMGRERDGVGIANATGMRRISGRGQTQTRVAASGESREDDGRDGCCYLKSVLQQASVDDVVLRSKPDVTTTPDPSPEPRPLVGPSHSPLRPAHSTPSQTQPNKHSERNKDAQSPNA